MARLSDVQRTCVQRLFAEGFERCVKCKSVRAICEFYVDKSRRDGLLPYCKRCQNGITTQWRRRNRAQCNAAARKSRKGSERYMVSECRSRALRRHHTNNPISLSELWEIWTKQEGKCALTGVELTWHKGALLSTSVSVDRIDCGKGYTADNVRFVCFAVNSFRGRMTDEETLTLAEKLAYRMRCRQEQAVDFVI